MAAGEWQRDGFTISTDREWLDRDLIWSVISKTYWGERFEREVFERSVDNALVFGLYGPDGDQIGFARVVTDYARFAWFSDLFVLETLRGRGLGRWLTETVLAYPPLAGIDRWLLATRDAQGFYRPFGFEDLDPGRFMLRQHGR